MPTLGYWAIRGLAQPIRLLLKYAGEDFDDVMYEQGDAPEYSRESWTKVKFTLGLPIPNLPYYVDGNIKITQSNAILRYIARKHQLLGEKEEERVKVDVMLDTAMDFRNGIVGLCYNPEFEKKKAAYFEALPAKLEMFKSFLGDQQFFAGSKVTVCDFPIYELLDQTRIMQPGSLDAFPTLLAFMGRIEALPAIKTFMSSAKFIRRPINNKSALFK
uniref:glutathione transferase n=1 Tax=Haliotis discus discus TaxID=91233 RepID=Q19BK2_HALDI|nr:glutathione-S-transferase isoform 1 [Haliotis discus discus]ABO26599.1 mu class glutathione-s-transferase [Haliotis discus discus]